jgi:hypothetical protein
LTGGGRMSFAEEIQRFAEARMIRTLVRVSALATD